MKNKVVYIYIVLVCFGCSKNSDTQNGGSGFNGTVIAYAPVSVSKTKTQRIFAHIVPWFETPASNTVFPGQWGSHWTMANENPNTILANGQRQIASYYYPLIGPYASGDTAVIDYELLLMKLSGIDGVFIDWPGTGTNLGANEDLPMTAANTRVLISRLGKVGLKYAIVYEDQYVKRYINKDSAASVDIQYLQSNCFKDPNYEIVNGQPLLLDFGPQAIQTGADWATVFSSLPVKPAFFTLEGQSSAAGLSATGEFAWVVQSNLTNLNNFYSSSYNPGTKISAVYSGYNSFYAQGGGSGPTLTGLTPSISLFQQTLALALQQPGKYIQLVTWNDYGEGTMIEPTDSATGGFEYSFLTTLQGQLGVQSLSQQDLEMVGQLYNARVNNVSNPSNLNKLNQIFYDIASLRMADAKTLLSGF